MELDSGNKKIGIKCLSLVLKNKNNCKILENLVDKATKGDFEFYKWAIYQICGLLVKGEKTVKEAGLEVSKGKIGWKSSTYDDISQKMEEFDDYLVNPFEIVQGVSQCEKCGSKRTWNVQKQTRSSDEPMTTFSRCVDCGNSWSYSG